MVLEGEAGAGKTTLALWAGEAARARHHLVLEAPCYQLSTNTPYACLVAALRPAVGPDTPDRTAGLPSLALLFEELAPADSPLVVPDPAMARTRLHTSIVTLLSRLSGDRPVVLVVDDLHWADPSSLEVLHLLTTLLPDLAVLVVASVRPREAEARPEVRTLVRALRRADTGTVIEVGRLDEEAIAAMLSARLGPIFPARLVREVHTRSGGTPLIAEELVRSWIDRGVLRPVARRWELGEPLDGPPVEVADDLVGARLDRLDDADRTLVAVVAAAAEPVTTALLARVTGETPVDLERRLERLRRHQILDVIPVDGAGAWAPHHPIIGQAALDRLGHEAVMDLHARYVDALDDTDLAHRGHHLVHLDPSTLDDERIEILVAAGRSAIERGAPVEATRFLGAALDALDGAGRPEDAARAELCRLLGTAWLRRGEEIVARDHLRRALDIARHLGDLELEALTVIDLHEASWTGEQTGRDFIEAAEALLPALDEADRPDLAARVACQIAMAYHRDGRVDRGRSAIARLGELAARVGPGDVEGWYEVFAATQDLVDLGDAREVLARAAPIEERADPELARRIAHLRLDCALIVGDAAEVRAAIDHDRRVRERWGDWPPWRVGMAAWDLAVGEGELDDAVEIDLALARGATFGRTTHFVHLCETIVALLRGLDPPPAPDDPADHAHPDAVSEHLRLVSALFASPDPAPELLDAVIEAGRRRPLISGVPWAAAAAVGLVHHHRGDVEALDRWRSAVHRVDGGEGRLSAWGQVLATRCGGGPNPALEAAVCFTRLGRPFDAAVALLDAAEAGAELSSAQLADVAARFASFGSAWLRDRLDAVMAERGWSTIPPVERRLDELGLTKREREVAEIVAEGLSNQEVANRLFVSVRTVTSHLDHIYTKLGISSRRELAALVERLRT